MKLTPWLAIAALVGVVGIVWAKPAKQLPVAPQMKVTVKRPTSEQFQKGLQLKVVSGLKNAREGKHWGDFKDDGCMNWRTHCGKKQYSSVLWGIPWGESWEEACANMPADVGGTHFDHPSNCVNVGPGINEWGEFYVSDNSCRCHPVCRVDPCGGGVQCVLTDPNTGECLQYSCIPGEVCDQQACC
jgi:hypothetical protein